MRAKPRPDIPSWAMCMADAAVQRLRAVPRFLDDTPEGLEDRLLHATHVHAQNVADYIWVDSEREHWDARLHVANARCPWQSAWITFRHPAVSNQNGRRIRIPEDSRFYCGMLHEEAVEGDRVTAYTVVFATDRPDGKRGVFWTVLTPMSEQGEVVTLDPQVEVPVYWYTPVLERLRAQMRHGEERDLNTVPVLSRLVALMTCAFANCRNVEAVQRRYVPLNKKARRRGEHAGKRYYVLGIHPVSAIASGGATRGGGGDAAGVSYHICRGHFADYRKGRGLFGKYHGRFWVPQHARGTRARGEVEKDYAVLGGGEPATGAVS